MVKRASEEAAQDRLHLYLGEEMVTRLKRTAKRERRSVSNLALLALEIGLEHLESRQKESVHD